MPRAAPRSWLRFLATFTAVVLLGGGGIVLLATSAPKARVETRTRWRPVLPVPAPPAPRLVDGRPQGAVRVALLGTAAAAATDAVSGFVSPGLSATVGGEAQSAALVVGTEADLSGAEAPRALEAVRNGVLLFVDAWSGDAKVLTALVPGATVRGLTQAEPPLSGPTVLAGLPPAHAAPDPRIVGAFLGERLVAVATRQDTLCHGCGCDAQAGRVAFGRNLTVLAARLLAERRANEEQSLRARVARGSLAETGATDLVVEAEFAAPSDRPSHAALSVSPIEGAAVATAAADLAAGERRSLVLRCGVPPGFDAGDHRAVASLDTGDGLARDVRPLPDLVGTASLHLLGPARLAPGGTGTIHALLLRDGRPGEGVPAATVTLALVADGGATLASATGTTDAHGAADLPLPVPEAAPGKATLVATARSPFGAHTDRVAVEIAPRLSAHLLADLPIHKPGEDVKVRALVVALPTGRPKAKFPVRFELRDVGNDPLARVQAETDAFGVASAALAVPADAKTQTMRLVVLGAEDPQQAPPIASIPLRIEVYEIPTFRLTVTPATRTLAPGDPLDVEVRATRFDGTPLAGAGVTVEARTDIAGAAAVHWAGVTDSGGIARVRQPLDGAPRSGALALKVTVKDAGGREVADVSWLVVGTERAATAPEIPLWVYLPNGGLSPGCPGTAILSTGLPGGAAVSVRVDDGPPTALVVDERGLVEVAVPSPGETTRFAVDDRVRTVTNRPSPIRLSLSRRVLAAGEGATVRVEGPPTARVAFVDVVRDGVLLCSRTVTLAGRAGETTIPLAPDVVGPLAVQALVLTGEGPPLVDARALFVLPPEALRVAARPSQGVAGPGEALDLDVSVTDAVGAPVRAALAVRVADEAVLSLAEAEPTVLRALLLFDGAIRAGGGTVAGTGVADLIAAAAKGPLSPSDARAAACLFATLDRAVAYGVSRRAEALGHDERLRKAHDLMLAHGGDLWRRARRTLVRRGAARDRDQPPTIDAALRAAERRGDFGRDGLVDPWGSPLRIVAGETGLGLLSPGVDALVGTEDDVAAWINPGRMWVVETAWRLATGDAVDEVRASDVVAREPRILDAALSDHVEYDADLPFEESYGAGGISDAPFEGPANNGLIGIGGGAGGAMRGRGGYRSLRAGAGGGRRARPWEDEPEVRRFFPAALLFEPSLVTGTDGRLRIPLTLPDSLTTWRATVVASDERGRAADTSVSFRTILPFSIDVDPPAHLRVGDVVEIPALVRSTAPVETEVTCEVGDAGTLLSTPLVRVAAGPSSEGLAKFRVRADRMGTLLVRVRAVAGERRDAVERGIPVRPCGREEALVANFTVPAGGSARRASLSLPLAAIDGASRAEVRVYASPVADAISGVEGLLKQPYG